METTKSPDFYVEKPMGFLITGIGASAGGIQALRTFFQHVPEDSGIAYVVILHLSPDHDSKLAQVLQTATTIPVSQVTEKTKIAADHIYVVPPNQHLIMEGDFITPSVNLHIEERRAPVDIFFRTLADTQGSRAICVVLSGTGANGSMGLKRIKEMGGVTYVQNPREAEFNEMPRNAIATDLVDEVLAVADIPAKIIAYRNSLGTFQIVVEAEKRPEQQQQALREIFTQLRIRTGHDFSNCKRPTLLRRIERRINVRNLPDLPSYAAFVHQNQEEATALLKDLLISVTNFFRDKKPWQAIEHDVLPAIFKGKKPDDEVRIWAVGCATGEEAYSIAMLLAERTDGVIDAPKVQVFATDIDEAAIATAREGFYTLNDAADVSPERLMRFFNKEGDGYRIKHQIRQTILFATHNFLKDPPFSRLDMVTCRNVLIYLNSAAQERVMESFHFALKPGGHLFLGSSESIDGAGDLYATLSREHHIFQSRNVQMHHYPVPENVPTFQIQKNEPFLQKQDNRDVQAQSRASFGELHQQLLEQYAPPSVVINEEYDIMHLSEKAGRFLEFSGGEPTQNLLKLVRPELRIELRTALYQAVQRKTAVEARSIIWERNGERQSVNLHVRPVTKDGDTAKGLILVIFDQNRDAQSDAIVVMASDEPVSKQLEEELIQVKAQLKVSVEQHEYQAEELKASNEELQAMNEELRSAAEELETSQEELQSINEELRTVNQELKVKIEEISLTSNNLQNLINSADVATLFLDRGFCTRLYTPAALQIFNLIPSDYGRPLFDITHRLQYNNLLEDTQSVLEKLTGIEREVNTTDFRSYIMRMLPYRTSEDRISGVVITFFDITKRRQAENALRQSEERMRLLIGSAKEYAILSIDADRRVTSWSSGAQLIFGYAEAEITGLLGDIVFVPEDRVSNVPEKEVDTARKEGRAENERWHLRKDGSRFWGSGITQPLKDEQGKTTGFVKIMRDLTEARRLEEAKFFLAAIVETSHDSVITIDFQRNITSWNKAAEQLYGYTAKEAIGRNLTLLTLPEDFLIILNKVDAIEHSREVEVFDTVRHNKEGDPKYLEIVMSPVLNTLGEVIGISTIARDVSDRKRREANLAFLAEINLDFAPLLTVHDVMQPVGEHLADFLQLSRCLFSLVDEEHDRVEVVYEYRRDENLPSLMGVRRISDSLTGAGKKHYGAGKLEVMNAAADSPLVKTPAHMLQQLGFGSLVDVPHLEGGRWKFLLTLGRAETRAWRSDEMELLQELASKLYFRIQRARAEEAMRMSEEKYRTLFESIDEGVATLEALFDSQNKAIDYRFLEINPAHEKMSGLGRNVLGRRVRELMPAIEESMIERVGQVALTGRPIRFEEYVSGLGRWFDIYLSRIGGEGSRTVASVFNNITERKEAEDRQSYLLRLSDALRPLVAAEEIQEAAAQMLGTHLDADRAYYVDIHEAANEFIVARDWHQPGAASHAKRYSLSDWPLPWLNNGKTWVVRDTATDPAMPDGQREAYLENDIGAAVVVPLMKQDRLVATFVTNQRSPRQWTQIEILLVEETAERTWAAVERARVEEALRKSEAKFRRLSDSGIVAVSFFDIEGSIVEANDAFLNLLGISRGELHSEKVLWDVYTPREWIPRTLEAIEEFKQTGQITPYEKQFYHSSGELRWALFAGATLEDGRTGVSLVVDITKLKRAEEALRQSEARLRTLADAVPQVIWTNTAEGRADYFNQRWYDYSGLTYEQSEGLGWQVIVHPDDAPPSVNKWIKALNAGEVFDTEYRLRGHDGSYRWFIGRNVPLRDDAGKIAGWFGSATDIENLKKTEEALSQSEARLRITMESATDYAIITMDTERRVERWSQGAAQLLGYTEAEMTGQSSDVIFTEEDRMEGVPQKEMQTARDAGRAADERWHRHKNGSRFYVSGVMRPIQNSVLTGYVKVMRDTTQQQMFTEELHRLVAERTKELQRSNEDLRQFAHVASHDLREPVRKIQTFANRLTDEFANKLPWKAQGYLGKIESATSRMEAMIDGVLNYSKVNNSAQTLEMVDLNSVIQQIETDLEVLIEAKKAVITSGPMPEVRGSNILLYQLFYNLILNSLKFSRAGEPALIDISSTITEEDHMRLHRISVADNGIGFDPEYAQVIFNTFTRLHSAYEYEGTGLGLALCKKIVERHNGTISASSRSTEGATFVILLPVAAP